MHAQTGKVFLREKTIARATGIQAKQVAFLRHFITSLKFTIPESVNVNSKRVQTVSFPVEDRGSGNETRVCSLHQLESVYVTIKHVHTVSFPAQENGSGNETRVCLESGTIPQWHAVLRRAKPCGWWRPPGSWGRSPRLGSC